MADPIKLLLIDDDPELRVFVRAVLHPGSGFEVTGEAATAAQAVELAAATFPDLILMDAETPGMDGPAAARALVAGAPESKLIAWTRQAEPRFLTEMIAAGACGYLIKGEADRHLVDALRWAHKGQSVLSREVTGSVLAELTRLYIAAEHRADDLKDSYLATVNALAAALETKDDQTGSHALRVRDYATILLKALSPSLLENESIVFGFLLHDVGKIGIPEGILTKTGPLNSDEWSVMRRHPALGADILKPVPFLQGEATEIVLHHHERWDGTGYPNGLAGNQVPLSARAFAVADTFDAMTSDRPYRKALPVEEAVHEIDLCSGTQFDPEAVEAFKESLPEIRWRMEMDAALA